MKYIYVCEFDDKKGAECSMCMLETGGKCIALGNRPKCPEEGCRKDCPLKEVDDNDKDLIWEDAPLLSVIRPKDKI